MSKKLHDIIISATDGDWSHVHIADGIETVISISNDGQVSADIVKQMDNLYDARFIANFDPNHTYLLIEGMTAVLDLLKCPICASKGIDGGHASLCPLGAVEAYWKERGLNG